MNLALAELRRSKGRYASITAALSLIVFLVLVLGALGDGLFFGGTGAVRTSTATAYAFSADAPGSLLRSRLPLSDEVALEAADGVRQATALTTLITTTDSVPGGADITVMGFGLEAEPAGVPSQVVAGRLPDPNNPTGVAVDAGLAESGLGVGSTIEVGGIRAPVIGVVSDAQYQGLPTVWASLETADRMRTAVRPETAGAAPAAGAFGLDLVEGTSADQITPPTGVTVLTSEQTYLAIPGIREQKASIDAIAYTSLAVAGLVVALFFALMVLDRRELFAALKALGASSARLGGGVVFQALGSCLTAVLVGTVAARLLGLALPGQIPLLFRPQTFAVSAVLLLVAGALGALLSLRRISRIDPATALGGSL